MGFYLNPGSYNFREAVNSPIYIDKTELIAHTNSVIMTKSKYLCVSRPRRFGKTTARDMLAAYYSRGIDSRELFSGFNIERDPSFEMHLNKYNVIALNIQNCLTEGVEDQQNHPSDYGTKPLSDAGIAIIYIKKLIINELQNAGLIIQNESVFTATLQRAAEQFGTQFIFLLDEWDCIFRIMSNDKDAQKEYLDFLRLTFKDQPYVALAYMTGILPVKKYGTHSALNMFDEYSMTQPLEIAEFFGFTDNEVKGLCNKYSVSIDEMREWYNGYRFPEGLQIYNPLAVVEAVRTKRFGGYWSQTETFEALKVYIDYDYDDLRAKIVRLLAGEKLVIEIDGYTNDMVTFAKSDDVLTLLIHLGYLGYDIQTNEVFIPNKEIRRQYVVAMETGIYAEVIKSVKASDNLLAALLAKNADTVAQGIQTAHLDMPHIEYNDENSLAATLSLAFYSAREYYNLIREMPAGKGFADMVFIPRSSHPEKPAIIIELKWDKSAESAINQIKLKQYPDSLHGYKGRILIAGINYDKTTREHICLIEDFDK